MPASFWLGRHPDELLCVLGYLFEGPRIGVLAVVAPVAQDHDRRAVVDVRQILVPEPLRGQPEVAVDVRVDDPAAEDGLDRLAHRVLLEELRHLRHLRHEDKRPHLREQVLHLVDEVQPEPRQVTRGEADIAQQRDARLLFAVAP